MLIEIPFPMTQCPLFYPSGIRLGTPGITTRGMKEKEITKISGWILKVVDHVKGKIIPEGKEERILFMKSFRKEIREDEFLKKIALEVKNLCKSFPVP